jgi:hypothetical protein
MQLVRESPDVPVAVHISHDGLQAHLSELELKLLVCEMQSILENS